MYIVSETYGGIFCPFLLQFGELLACFFLVLGYTYLFVFQVI